MIQRPFLKEHMNHIYLSENIIPYFSKIKSNSTKIEDVLSSYNIIRIYNVFNFVNDISIDELNTFSQHKFNKYYNKIKIKKGNEKIQKLVRSYYSALLTLKELSKDDKINEKISEAIERADKAIDELNKSSQGNKITIISIAHIIEHLLKGSVFTTTFLKSGGQTFTASCVMLISLAIIINLFMTAKQEHKKVIE